MNVCLSFFDILYEDFVDSSWISELEFNPDEHTVIMKLLSGHEYIFYDIDEDLFQLWINSPSKGRFYHEFIKDIHTGDNYISEDVKMENETRGVVTSQDVNYLAKRVKGKITQVEVILSGTESVPMTRLARILYEIEKDIKVLSEKRTILNKLIRRRALRYFKVEWDVLTKVLKTMKFAVTISARKKATIKKFDKDKYMKHLEELVLKAGIKTEEQLQELINAYTEEIESVREMGVRVRERPETDVKKDKQRILSGKDLFDVDEDITESISDDKIFEIDNNLRYIDDILTTIERSLRDEELN